MKGKKYGGRQKGTPNALTKTSKNLIQKLLEDYIDSGLMKADFMKLDSKDRLGVSEKLLSYIMPKMQSTKMDVKVDGKRTIEDTLLELSKNE